LLYYASSLAITVLKEHTYASIEIIQGQK